MAQLKNQYVFNSINELITSLDNSKVIKGRDTASDKSRDSSWCDTSSYQQARDYMVNGRLYDGFETDVNKYRTQGTAQKRVQRMSVQGHNVVVPLYLQGIPNNMITSKSVINNKIITIFYSVQAPHYVSDNDLLNGASEVLRNVISLESEGYRVNLYLIEPLRDEDGKWGFALRLKSDRETLNIKKMSFPLISSSFLRRIAFRVNERLYKDWIGDGYGSGVFDYDVADKFIRKHFGIERYEIWNYQGKQPR